ncbi:hypothetical protein CM19_03945 [Candidatus Acidianus copahuensis]|uniref:ArnR1-like winged helix-turn-helix domain-containing protein n=1 Tax=Candidatus Acidianus copahuensis TaxID=1160895 RepID=A0A031LT32_9CREN|nr:winged helix-turn-helix domain-containing protein [Candidatus Acidianus copahuensis]EZQ10624.1 hypothetical protein CM19_03945 [Candidatus Acidianus copahuensis]
MGRKRDKFDIIYSIFKASKTGVKKSKLANLANLSYELKKKYLLTLINAGYMVERDGMYYLTNKGQEYLKQIELYLLYKKKLQEILDDILGEIRDFN